MTSWPRWRFVDVDRRAHVDPQLAAAGEHVDGVVVVAAEEGAEAGRRLSQPVDLLLQRHDLVTGLAERRGEALVLRGERRERGLGLREPLLQVAGRARRVGEPTAQLGHLSLEEPHLRDHVLVGLGSATLTVVLSWHGYHLHCSLCCDPTWAVTSIFAGASECRYESVTSG